MIAIIVSMVGVGVIVWRRVGRLEHGDEAFERRLREDDERAEDGRRRKMGLPPIVRRKDQPQDPPSQDPPAQT